MSAELPTIGVEEELLLIDPATGHPVAKNREVADHAKKLGVDLQLELTRCQVETTTPVVSNSTDLRKHLVDLRSTIARAARTVDAGLLAVGVPPAIPDRFPITDTPRYIQIGERYGMLAHEQGISGCHVHVAVPDREAAVQVSNYLRPWLPLLLALTANSAIYRDADSGYASWRAILWARWPAGGSPPHFRDAAHYDSIKAMLNDTGAILDDGMVYWDIRVSENFPTVEVRVSDVPATVDECVTYAAIVRALVLTAVRELEAGREPKKIESVELRAAMWESARNGLTGNCIDLLERTAVPAEALLRKLIGNIRPALEDLNELQAVESALHQRVAEGNGAMRQRRAFETGGIEAVVAESARLTLA